MTAHARGVSRNGGDGTGGSRSVNSAFASNSTNAHNAPFGRQMVGGMKPAKLDVVAANFVSVGLHKKRSSMTCTEPSHRFQRLQTTQGCNRAGVDIRGSAHDNQQQLAADGS